MITPLFSSLITPFFKAYSELRLFYHGHFPPHHPHDWAEPGRQPRKGSGLYEQRNSQGRAAQNLEGSVIRSQTLHKFLKSFEKGRCQYNPNSVLVLDEAGMVDVQIYGSTLAEFRTQLEWAVREHAAYKITEKENWHRYGNVPAYPFGIRELYSDFRALDLPPAIWEAAAAELHVIRWPGLSAKGAVGAHLFLQAAANEPYQNLLRNTLRPLLNLRSDAEASEEALFERAYKKVTEDLDDLMWKHPYFSRRVALFGFAASAHLGHPLARLFVMRALCMYLDYDWWIDAGKKEDTKPLKDARRFYADHKKLFRIGLQNAQSKLEDYINVPNIEAFVDLPDEQLRDWTAVAAKAAIGLPYYERLLGFLIIRPGGYLSRYTVEEIKEALAHYVKAGEMGDAKGYGSANQIMIGMSYPVEQCVYPKKSHLEVRAMQMSYQDHGSCYGTLLGNQVSHF